MLTCPTPALRVLLASTAVLRFFATETLADMDVPALVKKARPAVFMLTVWDAQGKEIATGTGFCVGANGIVVTNAHVIKRAARIIAKAENGAFYTADGWLAIDEDADLAVIKLSAQDLAFLTVAQDSAERFLDGQEQVEVGERVVVIGSPHGLENTVTDGIVSAWRAAKNGRKWLQISAPISPGSSGSPVLNSKGLVVGVATFQRQDGQALNFARPADCVRELLTKESGPVRNFSELFTYGDLVSAARQLRERGDTAAALVKLREAMALEPQNPEAIAETAMTFERISLMDKASEQWKRIFDMGSEAGSFYIAAELRMKMTQGQAFTAAQTAQHALSGTRWKVVGIQPGDFLNVRYGPSLDFAAFVKLPNNTTGIQTTGEKHLNGKTEWVNIKVGDKRGWVRSKYLQPE